MKPLLFAALLAVGVVVGVVTGGAFAPYFGTLTLGVFIPVLIFEASWTLDVDLLRQNAAPVALLAVPGVIITAAIIAACAHAAGLPWHSALLLGAILSATDPVAVTALFRELEIPGALVTIVESESLLNDAIAVVLFRALLVRAALGAAVGVVASTLAGLALAWLTSHLLRRRVPPFVHIAATLVGAYGVYVAADRFGGTGIFAVLTFAASLRTFEKRSLEARVDRAVHRFWSGAAFAANCALFFLLGSAVDVRTFGSTIWIVGVTAGAVVAARAVLAYGLLRFVSSIVRPAWMHVVRMAGVRGALSVALALSLPAAVMQRRALVSATFAVAVIGILAGAVTYAPRLRRLSL